MNNKSRFQIKGVYVVELKSLIVSTNSQSILNDISYTFNDGNIYNCLHTINSECL